MKLVFYNDFTLGVIKGDTVVDVSAAVSGVTHTSPQDLINRVIEDFPQHRGNLQAAADQGVGVSLSQVRLRSPLPKPGNIVAMAVNYMEDGTRDEPAPINAFHKSPNAVVGHGDTMILPDIPATIFEGEAEMALVIGKRANQVRAEDAYDYVFGYLNFIDGSARGLQPGGNTFYQMKSRRGFAPMGPWLVTADEIEDPHNLPVRLWVNEDLKQNFNTNDMAHQIPRIVEWVSSLHELEPGDVIATGTNHRGLSAFQDGDNIELEVQGLGTLQINVQDGLKRVWPRTTRLEMAEQGREGTAPQSSGKYAPG
jgi:2-keto-4-pentenoate hydratase/2-oxohepta-3-ene-1,7-dioic acid hydratase in catechol pathway